ncbi:MAG: DNA/RNA non-specific endonuclease [Proteobacteria bacterium]|nr:MAG: DNA/RNA non-specific endonuclease [Pseudomonadota bacterium]
MSRFLPLLLIFISACQSTSKRGEKPSARPDKSLGPQFDDDEVPDAPVPNKPSDQSSPETPVQSQPEPTAGMPGESVLITSQALEGNPNLPFGPLAMTGGEASWIIARDQYVISWNPTTRNPNWVSWKLSLSDLGSIGRQDNFTIDPDLKTYITQKKSTAKIVASSDYTGSCFDRGHMVASSDRQASEDDNIPTFHMTNIVPQTAFNNQRVWKGLEDEARKWLEEGTHQNLWLVSGPVYEKTLHFIDKGVAIPSATFKLIYSWDENAQDKPFLVKAILVPNMTSNGKLAYEDKVRLCAESKSGGQIKNEPILKSMKYDDYQATILQIEAAAHIKLPAVAH